MTARCISVPRALLLDPDLTPSAKLLWVLLRAEPGAPASRAFLQEHAGLTRHTVRRALQQLASGKWSEGPGGAAIPCDLLLDPNLGAQAKLLYGILQLVIGVKGQFTIQELSLRAGASPNTLREAATALSRTGWIDIAQPSRRSPFRFTLRHPAAEQQAWRLAQATFRLEQGQFKGETIMREYLSLLIDSDEFEDNATPGFLVNPLTGHELQFDRYYPPRVALEFNGAQHDGPTERFPRVEAARRQQARDYIKLGISAARGITLVVLRPKDLTLETIRQKVDGLLPLRCLDDDKPLIDHLEKVSSKYREKASRPG